MALGEALTVRVADEGNVKPRRRFPAEGAVEEELAGGAEEEVRPAHDFGNLHGVVVGDDGELIARHTITPPNEKITEVFSGNKVLRAEVPIDVLDRLAVRHAEAPVQLAGLGRVASRAGRRPQPGRKDRFGVTFMRGGEGGLDIFARVRGRIDRPGGSQVFPDRLVKGESGTLRLCRFVPVEAEPAQIFDRLPGIIRLAAVAVEVFKAVEQRSARRPCARPSNTKGAGVPPMEFAGRRRREASAIG